MTSSLSHVRPCEPIRGSLQHPTSHFRKFLPLIRFGLLILLALSAGRARADNVSYQFDITTTYQFGISGYGGTAGPDSGGVTITNNGTSTFVGTLGGQGTINTGGTLNATVTNYTLAPGQSVFFVMGNESSNVGGFNGTNGAQIVLNGVVTGPSGATQSLNLSVYDKDIHSGVFRTNPYGVNLDNYVLEGGDATRDTGDDYETTQANGHYTFAQYGQDLGLQLGISD